MLLTRIVKDTITHPLVVLALLQFPFYGLVLDCSASQGHLATGGLAWIVTHLIAVILCFLGLLPNFS